MVSVIIIIINKYILGIFYPKFIGLMGMLVKEISQRLA